MKKNLRTTIGKHFWFVTTISIFEITPLWVEQSNPVVKDKAVTVTQRSRDVKCNSEVQTRI